MDKRLLGFWLLISCSLTVLAARTSYPKCLRRNHYVGFICSSDSKCIYRRFQCDGHKDCSDGSDEDGCPRFDCFNGQHHYSIPISWRCNGYDDCLDGSDEHNCSGCTPNMQFTCANGKCINQYLRCDNAHDCVDGSDESDCDQSLLTDLPGSFKCDNGKRTHKSNICDDYDDCGDNSDERDCARFACADGQKTIRISNRCDGYRDCKDGSDELDCHRCDASQFRCSDGRCTFKQWKCDGYGDCSDGSDEKNCTEAISETSGTTST